MVSRKNSKSVRWLARTPTVRGGHRRRINTEENAKVVAAFLGTELIQFLAALSYLAPGLFEERMKKRMNKITATVHGEMDT